jgi:glutamate--cysteine ligase
MPTSVVPVPRAELLDELTRDFAPARPSTLRVGIEVEWIPVRRLDGARLPIEGAEGETSGRAILERASRAEGWEVSESRFGTPQIDVPSAGRISFEPGGQFEFSSLPMEGLGSLAAARDRVLGALHAAADIEEVDFVYRGMDPDDRTARMFVDALRYRRQRAHYDRIGPWGGRMMCEGAAIHVNLDLGGRSVRRWWVANRMTPYMVALFANSSQVRDGTTLRSARAEQWRHLDPSRTGVRPRNDDPVRDYFHFALDASDFLSGPEGEPARSFRESWANGAELEAWRAHLSTVFPEARPRGYLELRSFDALRPGWQIVPALVAVGLLYDPGALTEAEELLPEVDDTLLMRAGREGLGDPAIAKTATDLFDLAVAGARRLGEPLVNVGALEIATAFRERFVGRGLDPGSEDAWEDPFRI